MTTDENDVVDPGPHDLDPLDLDPSDLAEVMRRVVVPVVDSLMRPGEVLGLRVEVREPDPRFGWEERTVWAVVTAEGALGVVHGTRTDSVEVYLADAGDGPRDPQDLTSELYSQMTSWLPTTAPSWGEERDGDYELPGPRPVPPRT